MPTGRPGRVSLPSVRPASSVISTRETWIWNGIVFRVDRIVEGFRPVVDFPTRHRISVGRDCKSRTRIAVQVPAPSGQPRSTAARFGFGAALLWCVSHGLRAIRRRSGPVLSGQPWWATVEHAAIHRVTCGLPVPALHGKKSTGFLMSWRRRDSLVPARRALIAICPCAPTVGRNGSRRVEEARQKTAVVRDPARRNRLR
jgi:hypothetical protein